MRVGWIISAIAHVGFILALLEGCPAVQSGPAESGVVVPIEIVATAPESNVRALAVPQPEDATAAAAAETTPEPAPTPSPSPAPPPPNQPPRPQHQADQFDLASIARMVDRSRQAGHERTEGAPAERNQRGAGQGTQEVVALQDRVRAIMTQQMRRCWRAPIDLPNPDRLVVTVQFDLDRNGNLRGQPRVTAPANYNFDPAMRIAVEAAVRAIRECNPYPFPSDPVVGDHYETWGALEHTFRPRSD